MRLILASALTALASAGGITSGITATCKEDNTIAVVINHDIPGKILKATYGSCAKGDAGIDGFAGDHNTTWTGTLTPSRCNMDGKLRNLKYNQTAEFTVGREDDGNQLVFTTYDIDTFCELKNTYTVSFDYGTIRPDEKKFTDDGGLIGLHFYFESTDSDFNNTKAVSNSAGDTIYLTLQLNDTANENFNHAENFTATSGKAFVPTKCFVKDSGSNKNYTLFDTDASKCSNDIIDLMVNYDSDDHVWQIKHTIFLLDNEVRSTYTLTCDVLVCDMQQGDDCKTAHSCLTSNEASKDNEACTPSEEFYYYDGYDYHDCQSTFEYVSENLHTDTSKDLCHANYFGGLRFYNIHDDDDMWRDVCCPQNYEETKDCTF